MNCFWLSLPLLTKIQYYAVIILLGCDEIQKKSPKGFMIYLTMLRPKLSPHNIQIIISYYLSNSCRYIIFNLYTFKQHFKIKKCSCSTCYVHVILCGAANTVYRLCYKIHPFCVAHLSYNYWAVGFKIDPQCNHRL